MKKVIWLTVIFIISLTYLSFGADAMYRLLHNDHDTLIVGEVKKITNNGIEVAVSETIVSSKDLNKNSVKRQLKPKYVTIEKIDGYIFNYDNKSNTYLKPKVGDYIMASLNKETSGKYKIAWGCFKVSGPDYKTLDIVINDNPSEYQRMDAAAIKSFINSNGRNTEFSFDGTQNEVYLNKDGQKQVIYKGIVRHTATITPAVLDVEVTATPSGNKGIFFSLIVGIVLIVIAVTLVVKSKK